MLLRKRPNILLSILGTVWERGRLVSVSDMESTKTVSDTE